MKFFNYLLFSLFISAQVNAQKVAEGYLINNNNDSVAVQIKIRKGLTGKIINEFDDRVEVDSNSITKTFKPNDIKAFGFTYNGYLYRFFSKPIKKGGYKFVIPNVLGRKASFYQYGTFTSGTIPSSQVFYTFEKADGSSLLLSNRLNKTFRTELRSFFNDQPEVQKFIDTRLKDWLDLDRDLKAIFYFANKTDRN